MLSLLLFLVIMELMFLLLREMGYITRKEINDEYAKRASSGVVLILSQVPLFEFIDKPLTLRLKSK